MKSPSPAFASAPAGASLRHAAASLPWGALGLALWLAALPGAPALDEPVPPAVGAETETAGGSAAPPPEPSDSPEPAPKPEAAAAVAPPEPAPRPFLEIPQSPGPPEVAALARLDETHAFFLNRRGQIGIAKFSPGLSLIGWQLYSELATDALPQLALGPEYSVVYASPWELTQGFDTEGRGMLDFHQALLRDWRGRDDGVHVTAGPVADRHGRLLFALAPQSHEEDAAPTARIYAWHPEASGPVAVIESLLPVAAFTLSREGTVAALLDYPEYGEGYYVSLTDLPPFHPGDPDAPPDPLPLTEASLLVPSSLTGRAPLRHLAYFQEKGQEKLLALAPETGTIVEILAERAGDRWRGGILLRQVADGPVRPRALAEMAPGQLLAGGEGGFARLDPDPEAFRITAVELASDGLVLHFSEELDRETAISPESVRLRSSPLDGGASELPFQPVLEREGRTLVLKSALPSSRAVLRIACDEIRSTKGQQLMGATAFFVIN